VPRSFPVLLACLALLAPLVARAEGTAQDLRAGAAARDRKPPDDATARAAFERAASSSDAETAASGLFFLGDLDEQELRFADAVASYDGSIARLPSGRYAQRAATRSSAIRTHAEGGYAPLARLERVRRDPALANDPAAIDGLVKEAETFPPGPVRVEARLLAAEAYRGRLGRPKDQLALLWLVVHDPKADVIAAREAAVEIVDANILLGDLDEAARAAAELGPRVDAHHRTQIAHLLRRRLAHAASLVELALFSALALFAIARGGASAAACAAARALPSAAGFCLFAGAAGGFLATSYDSGTPTPFLMVAPAMLAAILVARAWSAVGSRARFARGLRAGLCAGSVFAAALLLLERVTPQYLDGFGL
jgi:hypothetical protein